MAEMRKRLARLRRFNSWIRNGDAELRMMDADLGALGTLGVREEGTENILAAIATESIALRQQRPVLAIKENVPELVFIDEADRKLWHSRLEKAAPFFNKVIKAVGRVNVNGGRLAWAGTGWLVSDSIMVTNRHVAEEFARRDGEGFSFKIGADGQMSAETDFLEEIGSEKELIFKLVRPLHIEPKPGPDLAFFEIEVTSGNERLAKPIDLAAEPMTTADAATIGYPAYDSRVPEPDLMEHIFGRIYDKKRLAPGNVKRVDEVQLLHDCTTLGGNSGSVVVDFMNEQAIGLHFSGSFLAANYAVRSDVVKKLLDKVRTGRTRVEVRSPPPSRPRMPVRAVGQTSPSSRVAALTIPLTISVTVATQPARSTARPWAQRGTGADYASLDVEEEAVVEDYKDREGYLSDFLGDGLTVDLPVIERSAKDILAFKLRGKSETELKYEHFSVVMSRSRRMCFFSAVNIDGNLSKKSTRVKWKWDPRLLKEQQIMQECYGDSPRFSRGHMTRREDPGWGDATTAKRGNEDSMHVTNVAPQMQAFNAPIWLALEDYALRHAREDEMKISVFTGPYFHRNDPEMYGVRIPLAFWKIIAFMHDDTGKLCATGYEMNQEKTLEPEEEFVFGAFTSPQLGTATQVSIRSIETRSGISFGQLANVDPLGTDEESLAGGETFAPLESLEQIRFY